jgi:hypothetical protein
MSELTKLRNALRKLVSKEDKLLKIIGSSGGDTSKNEKKLLDIRGRKKETIADIAEIEYEQSKNKSRVRGGGGAMMDLSQRTGATARGTLFKKRMN